MKNFFTLTLCFLTLSLTAQVDCPNPYDGNGDGNVSIGDFLEMLAVFGDTDADSDGVWDSLDDCVDLAACNYANDPSEPCAYIDVLGVCGGGCEGDGDDDGICDSEDDCVGVLDECGVCNGPGPTEIVIESITFQYDSVYLPLEDDWYVYEISTDTTFSYTCAPYFGECGDLVSHEGYDYSTVQIGEQCWFAENCRYLPSVSDPSIDSTTEPHYSVYGYTGTDVTAAQATYNYETYGVLYNWPAVMTEGICPSGWHIPSDGEWQTMEMSLGMSESESAQIGWRGSPVGDYMKSTSGWNDYYGSSGNGSNSSGFNGLPGGYRYSIFTNVGYYGIWWSASESGSDSWKRELVNMDDIVGRNYGDGWHLSFSARCVIDYTDDCGVLNGDNSTCLDDCGVPNGDNSTCFTSCGDDIGHDGYDYSTVQIGDQCWFSENCRYLPEVSPSSESSETAPYYYVYGYEGTDVTAAKATGNYGTYGVLYNESAVAVMYGAICPSNWHISSSADFNQLTSLFGGVSVAGHQLKDDEYWNGSNSSGFTALPGGYYNESGSFDWGGNRATFWASTSSQRFINGYDSIVGVAGYHGQNGFSARCVRD